MRRLLAAVAVTLLALTPPDASARFDDGARYAFVASPSDQSIFIIEDRKSVV